MASELTSEKPRKTVAPWFHYFLKLTKSFLNSYFGLVNLNAAAEQVTHLICLSTGSTRLEKEEKTFRSKTSPIQINRGHMRCQEEEEEEEEEESQNVSEKRILHKKQQPITLISSYCSNSRSYS